MIDVYESIFLKFLPFRERRENERHVLVIAMLTRDFRCREADASVRFISVWRQSGKDYENEEDESKNDLFHKNGETFQLARGTKNLNHRLRKSVGITLASKIVSFRLN